MYKSPVELVMGEMRMKLNGTITQAIQDVDINVDKEELERALQYDRGQYDKGYSDGYKDAIKEFAESLKESLSKLEANSPNKTYKTAMQDMLDYYFPKIIDDVAKEMRCNDA